MDYNNGLKTAREKGVEQGKREMILELHNIGLPAEKIAQAAKRSVNEVISIVKKYKKKDKVLAV